MFFPFADGIFWWSRSSLWGIGCQATLLGNEVKTDLSRAVRLKLTLPSQFVSLISNFQVQATWWAPIFSNKGGLTAGELKRRKQTLVSATNIWKLICSFLSWLCSWAYIVSPGNKLKECDCVMPLCWWRCMGDRTSTWWMLLCREDK